MRDRHRAAHPDEFSMDREALRVFREALRSFVDAYQVLAGRIESNEDESIALVREHLSPVLRHTTCEAAYHASTNFRVQRAVRCIEERFAESTIRLASVASAVDITPPHLARLLKEHTGLTFLQQLRRIRMHHAEQLLATTAASIKQTAYACGYSNLASFGRDFQRTHACAPRVWRAASN